MSPTARTLECLRELGYLAEVVEKRIPHTNVTKDLWGFIDVLAIKDGEILGVQVTSRGHISDRLKKIAEHENVAAVRKAGIHIQVHGWGKMANGKWQCRVVDCS